MGEAHLLNIHAADGDFSVFRSQGIEPVQQVHERSFAGPGAAEDTEGGSGGNRQGDVVQHLRRTLIGEGNMVKTDIPVQGRCGAVRFWHNGLYP